MINFAPLRTARLDVRLRELGIGNELSLCHMPLTAHEKTLTEFLNFVLADANAPTPRHLTDPRAWSVSERFLVLAHYNLHVRDDAPDWAVTETSKLSDYLDPALEPGAAKPFQAARDTWTLRPLSGAMAEALETLQLESTLVGLEHWVIGAMACQLLREGEESPDAALETADFHAWLAKRMTVLKEYPSSDFDALFVGYRVALAQSTQYFTLWFDDEGVIVLPKTSDTEAAALLPAARFLADSALGRVALSLSGKSE
jgi:hypothetical protein